MDDMNNIHELKKTPVVCSLYSLDNIFISLNKMHLDLMQSTARLEAFIDEMIEFDLKLTALNDLFKALLGLQNNPEPKDSDNAN